MAGIKDYSTTQANNTTLNSISTAEGMLPSNLNNAIRALMKNTRDWYNDSQWVEYGDGNGAYTATYASATSFTIDGVDVTAIYHASRRIKLIAATPGTIYGTVSSTSFSTNTTVNVTWDSGSLSSEAITNVYISALSKTNSSIPTGIIGTTNIDDDAVTTAKIADSNITVAKMAVNSVDSDQYVDGSIDTAHIADAQITTAKITDSNVTTAKIASDAITGAKIADDSINSEHYVDGSIDTAHIANSQITLDKMASDSVNSSKIVDGSIVNADVNASAAIDATKIADGTVTSTEFQHINTLSSNAQTQLDAKVAKASNLSDLASASTSRTNLGLGTIATQAANSVSISGGSITGLGTPSASSDAATKVYVDGLVTGLKTRIICRVATTANITTATDLQAGDTIDGVTLVAGDRVLVKDQSTQTQNGIYLAVASGQSASRDPEFDTVAELAGQMVITQEGSAGADKFFLCTTDNSGSIGSVNITFTVVQPSNVGDVTLNGTQTLTNKTLTAPVINSPTGDFIKIEGTNFTDSLLVGHSTTGNLSSAEQNTGIGIGSLDAITSGNENIALGYNAGSNITTASGAIIIGSNSGDNITATLDNIIIGRGAFRGSGVNNNSSYNVSIGSFSMAASSNAAYNVAIGKDAGKGITSGDRNVCLGYDTDNITSGSGNIVIGAEAVVPSATGNRQLVIAGNDGSTTTTWISGDSNGVVTANGGTVATAGDVTSLAIALG
jgi:hypothetical protein